MNENNTVKEPELAQWLQKEFASRRIEVKKQQQDMLIAYNKKKKKINRLINTAYWFFEGLSIALAIINVILIICYSISIDKATAPEMYTIFSLIIIDLISVIINITIRPHRTDDGLIVKL